MIHNNHLWKLGLINYNKWFGSFSLEEPGSAVSFLHNVGAISLVVSCNHMFLGVLIFFVVLDAMVMFFAEVNH
jgi:hypothetical protein